MATSTPSADNPIVRAAQTLYSLPYLLLPLAVLFWAGNFLIGRAVRADVPPVGLAFWRWTDWYKVHCGEGRMSSTTNRVHTCRRRAERE
jgi:hypothetical protein